MPPSWIDGSLTCTSLSYVRASPDLTDRHCEKLFFPPPTDLDIFHARWCNECQRHHPASNGQGWLFSTYGLLFAKRKFYVAEYDKVSPPQALAVVMTSVGR